MMNMSVQPEWCRRLALQQQSVLFLAGRGPDGMPKQHPCKAIHVALRGCLFKAAKYGRELEYGEKADGFMSLDEFANDDKWRECVQRFFTAHDQLPHHYINHLMHAVQILGYKHPKQEYRKRWMEFYLLLVDDFHLKPESEFDMDNRLGDWDKRYW